MKTAGDQEFYLLHWDGEGGVPAPEFFPKADFKVEGLAIDEDSECNTKKNHGRQFYRYPKLRTSFFDVINWFILFKFQPYCRDPHCLLSMWSDTTFFTAFWIRVANSGPWVHL